VAQTNVNESAAEPAVEQAATAPEPPAMKYAWQGWNDPAYQREAIQNSAEQYREIAGHADTGGGHAPDAPEGATTSLTAATTNSG
jgi:hypothetical protein